MRPCVSYQVIWDSKCFYYWGVRGNFLSKMIALIMELADGCYDLSFVFVVFVFVFVVFAASPWYLYKARVAG